MIVEWRTDTPPTLERLLIFVSYPDQYMSRPKIHIGYYDGQWKWEGGAITGTVTHWMPLPLPPEKL
jgi:hypothetical protein